MTSTAPGIRLTNWSGNHRYRAPRFHEPASLDELAAIVAGSSSVKILGTRHAFNDISDTDGDLVSMANIPPEIRIDDTTATVTVGGGVTYGMLAPVLHAGRLGAAEPRVAAARRRGRRRRHRNPRLGQQPRQPGHRGRRHRDPDR